MALRASGGCTGGSAWHAIRIASSWNHDGASAPASRLLKQQEVETQTRG
jgi:hypothetical protein